LNGSLTELCRNPLNYLVGQFFDYESTGWRLFQKLLMTSKLEIYFIYLYLVILF
jgi:hypothetical protein